MDFQELRASCENATWDDLELAQAIIEERKRRIKQQRIDELNKEVIEMLKKVKRSGMDFRLMAPDGQTIGYIGKDHINVRLEYAS